MSTYGHPPKFIAVRCVHKQKTVGGGYTFFFLEVQRVPPYPFSEVRPLKKGDCVHGKTVWNLDMGCRT